jgi:hypothetical protein
MFKKHKESEKLNLMKLRVEEIKAQKMNDLSADL